MAVNNQQQETVETAWSLISVCEIHDKLNWADARNFALACPLLGESMMKVAVAKLRKELPYTIHDFMVGEIVERLNASHGPELAAWAMHNVVCPDISSLASEAGWFAFVMLAKHPELLQHVVLEYGESIYIPQIAARASFRTSCDYFGRTPEEDPLAIIHATWTTFFDCSPSLRLKRTLGDDGTSPSSSTPKRHHH